MSILAHVIDKGGLKAEPAATQALAYILGSNPDIARAFVGLLQETDLQFELGQIEAELQHEEIQPDLTIHDSESRARVFVENKFWAGLTDQQPVAYLRRLPEDPPSALMFVVPEQRIDNVWDELKVRCAEAKLEWEDASGGGATIRARIGGKTMMIASWRYVLERLLDAASSGKHDNAKRDILQLRGLTSREDSQAFLPLRVDEVTDQRTARRMVNYCNLIEEITGKLKGVKVADTKKLLPTHGYHWTGRYLRLHGRFGVWLGVHRIVWRDAGITPLWLHIGPGKFYSVGNHFEKIPELFGDVQSYQEPVGPGGGRGKYIPIRLTTGVERERVVDDAVEQMKRIADTLREVIPDPNH